MVVSGLLVGAEPATADEAPVDPVVGLGELDGKVELPCTGDAEAVPDGAEEAEVELEPEVSHCPAFG